jgi:chromosome segregation ATPase
MKHIILLALTILSVLAQEQNIPHDIKVLKQEMKEMKHYLHELKELIQTQNKVIIELNQKVATQEEELTSQKEKISEMNQKIQLFNEGSLFQEERIKTLTKEVEGLKKNETIYVQKLDLLAFFESLDPNRVTDLYYLRNYGGWIINHP